MATQNDYSLVWMNPNQMMMPEGSNMHQQVPPDMMAMDQSSQMDTSYFPMPVPPPFESVSQPPVDLDGFLMMEDFDGDYCGEPPRYMTAATQTLPNLRRKILPVKHPGLKLQTPIAFKCDTDPNVIPIEKDGMAICEKCGAIGVKHAFYTRHRKYCSLACARGLLGEGQYKEDKDLDDDSSHSQDYSNLPSYKFPNGVEIKEEELVTKEMLPLSTGDILPSFNLGPHVGTFPFTSLELPDERVPPILSTRVKQELSQSYDWLPKFRNPAFVAAPVNCFKHAPMSDCWDDITVGMKVEVENSDLEAPDSLHGFSDSFWVATVLCVAGYKALLRYEGFDADRDFWVNLCSSNVHPVGWCAMRGKPLIPPRTIAENCKDWKEFLVRRLTGARTLPSNFYMKVTESMKSRFRVGLHLEVVDKIRICQMCVATVKRIVGKRLHLVYYNADNDDAGMPCFGAYAGFWCHEDSPLIHPVGWSARVRHQIDAPDSYLDRCESGLMGKDDASEELFTAPFQSVTDWNPSFSFQERMKLEAIDPLNLSAICAATVKKVLRDGYLMIRIDSYSEDSGDGSDWFCYHSSSPCIFPPGFCHENGVPLVPPNNHSADTFSWDELAASTGCTLAPASLFHREIPEHGILAGMQLESADLMDPRLVCVATVSLVVGRLLKIHFDGWEEEYDQWMDCTSPDLYPVGWCALVSHKLEAPRSPQKTAEVVEKKKVGRRGKRMKGKVKGPNCKKQLHVEQQSAHSESVAGVAAIHAEECMKVESEMKSENSFAPSSSASLTSEVEMTIERDELPLESASHPVDHVDSPSAASSPSRLVDPVQAPSVGSSSPSTTNGNSKLIPRLADGSCLGDSELTPNSWTCEDVATFLRLNDCGVYADSFLAERKTGSDLLTLTQDEIMELTYGKIGPTIKIFAVIQQLNQQLKLKAAKAGRKINL